MLLCGMLLSSLAEVISLGSILPFIGALSSPEKLLLIPMIASIGRALGVVDATDLIVPMTLIFIMSTLLAGLIRLIVLLVSTKLAFAIGVDLSIDMYRRTLHQPYEVHIDRNSSEVISGIAHKTSTVVVGVLLPLLMLASSVLILVFIISTLVAIDSGVALISAAGFGLIYGIITWFSRHQLKVNSQRIALAQVQLFKALQEGLGGIRDVILDNSQELYCNIYHEADVSLRKAQGSNIFISSSPRFALEALGMSLIALLAYRMSTQSGGLSAALPVLGALALGAQRLIPALQLGYASWATVVGNTESLIDVLRLLDQPSPQMLIKSSQAQLSFQHAIRFDGVRFRYNKETPWVVNGLNITIQRGARVGFVGSTGSGKSTVVDLLMGLLLPTEGDILIDDRVINKSLLSAWQKNIAHVPQTVYLADASIADNIAFGQPIASIDMVRVKAAAKQAQIADFIESAPGGYQAFVGERGVRLSGGQRQRIGIARALYKQATVLIFDEATSALDTVTEQAVMDAIDGLGGELTIVLIAHRLSTVRKCNLIFELSDGCVASKGTYDQLMLQSETFRAMNTQVK